MRFRNIVLSVSLDLYPYLSDYYGRREDLCHSKGGVITVRVSASSRACLTSNPCCAYFSRSMEINQSLCLSLERNSSFCMITAIISRNIMFAKD